METFFASLFLVALGLGAAWMSRGYGIGSAHAPGAGYFPLLLGLLLAALATAVAVREFRARRKAEAPGAWPVRQLGVIIGALLAFAVAMGGWRALGIPGLGLLPATFLLVLVSGQATRGLTLRGALVLALLLSAGAWAIFTQALDMVVPLFPWSY